MLMLAGKYYNKLDQKNRMFVPAKFREALGQEFYLTLSKNKDYIQCYSEAEFTKKYENEIENNTGEYLSDEDARISLFSDTETVSVDSQGRITIPPELAEKIGLKDTALVTGMGNFVAVWNAEVFEARRTRAVASSAEKEEADTAMRRANIIKKKKEAYEMGAPKED